MAVKKLKSDFTSTVVPDLPASVTSLSTLPSPEKALAKVQADLAKAKAQLAKANEALAKLKHPRPVPPGAPKKVTPPPVTPPPVTPAGAARKPSEETQEDMQFVVELPEDNRPTVPSGIQKVLKKAKRPPKTLSIDYEDHPELAHKEKVDAGKRLVNPAALACGSYIHGEGPEDDDDTGFFKRDAEGKAAEPTRTAIVAHDLEAGTFIHQGLAFNFSEYASAGVGSIPRRLAAFLVDLTLSVMISFIFMPTAQFNYWINLAKDLSQAVQEFFQGPIFHIGFVIEAVTNGQVSELSLGLDKFTNIFKTYLPMLDLKGLFILGTVWAVVTIPAIFFWDRTLGQRIFHLRIMHIRREHPGLVCAILRQMVFLPLSILSVIGLLMGFTGSRRCWHDHLSGCKVATSL